MLAQREAAPLASAGRGNTHSGVSGLPPRQGNERAAQIGRTRQNALRRPAESPAASTPPAMQHDDGIAGHDLIKQMCRPQHCDPTLPNEPAHLANDRRLGRNVQPDCWFVQHQDAWLMQKRPGDPRPVASARPYNLRTCSRARDHRGRCRPIQLLRTPARLAATADTVQRGVIQQIFHHREIKVERARLEHHAQQAQSLPRLARHAMLPSTSIEPSCVS